MTALVDSREIRDTANAFPSTAARIGDFLGRKVKDLTQCASNMCEKINKDISAFCQKKKTRECLEIAAVIALAAASLVLAAGLAMTILCMPILGLCFFGAMVAGALCVLCADSHKLPRGLRRPA